MEDGGRPASLSLAAIALLLATIAPGCEKTEPSSERIHLRFVEEPPHELFDASALVERRPAMVWSFTDQADASRWLSRRGARSWSTEGLRVSVDSDDVVLTNRLALDTDEVEVFELSIKGRVPPSTFFLEWAAPRERFAPESSHRVRLRSPPGSSITRVTFELGRHPAWNGSVDRLRLRVQRTPRDRPVDMLLLGVAGFDLAPSTERLEAALEDPHQVNLGGDVRSALAATAGTLHERRLRVPAGARLRLAYGTVDAPGVPLQLRVEVTDDDGSETLLLDERIGIQPRPRRWTEATMDLAEFAEREVRLSLRVNGTESTAQLAPDLVFWAHPEILRSDSAPSAPNLLLVSIDTLRADRLSLYGNPRSTSPRLDAWAERHSTVFLQTVAPSPWTLPSHLSILTGQDALRHGINHTGPAPPSAELLAERLRREGYTTVAVTGGAWFHPRFGLAQGFDRYLFWRHWGSPEESAKELESGLAKALEILGEEHGSPLFLFFHTYEVHEPYLPREPFYSAFGGMADPPVVDLRPATPTTANGFVAKKPMSLRARSDSSSMPPEELTSLVTDLYDSAIAYTDEAIGTLLEAFEEARPDPLIVVTSDHGEMLGEHGLSSHNYLYDPNLLVPLLVRAPSGLGAGKRIDQQVRSSDIVPTILELAELPPDGDLDGRSLVPLMQGAPEAIQDHPSGAWSYASKSNFGVSLRVGGRTKYIFNSTAWNSVQQREQLFDLDSDPMEMRDLSGESDTEALRRRALNALTELPGLRLRATNGSEDSLSAVLSGLLVDSRRVELISSPCSCISWLGGGRAALRLDPGETVEILFEEVEAHELALDITLSDGEPFEARVPLGELLEPRVLELDPSTGWLWSGDVQGEAKTSFTIRWHRTSLRGSAIVDDELNEQLRALGYL